MESARSESLEIESVVTLVRPNNDVRAIETSRWIKTLR